MSSLSHRAGLAALVLLSSVAAPAAFAGTGTVSDCSNSLTTVMDRSPLALPATDSTTYRATIVANGPGTTYQWGSYRWKEPAWGCRDVGQTFDFWPAQGGDLTTNHPTIVYFHPNATGSHLGNASAFYNNVILPAITSGWNVASVEFRHPVIDQYLAPSLGGQVPANDTGLAIQFLRAHAKTLGVSTNNLFAFGYSRGSLSLWQQLQPDLGGGTTGRPSSLVSGYFGYQSQTTYQCNQYESLFLDPNDPSTADYIAQCNADNPYEAQFGSAVSSVTAGSLPVHLQYQQDFVLQPGTRKKIQKVGAAWLVANFETEHYPDYGIALLNAYAAHGNTRMQYPEPNIPAALQFTGWQDFVKPLLKPDAP